MKSKMARFETVSGDPVYIRKSSVVYILKCMDGEVQIGLKNGREFRVKGTTGSVALCIED